MARQVAAVSKIYFYQIKSWFLWFMLYTVLFPLGLIFFTRALGGSIGAARLAAGGTIFAISAVSINATGYWVMNDRFLRQFELLKSMPMHMFLYYISISFVAVCQSLVNVHVLIAVLKTFHLYIHYSFWIVPATVIVSVAFSSIGLLLGRYVKDMNHGSLMMNLIGSGLVFICPIFYPASVLPERIADFATYLPHTVAFRMFSMLYR